MSENRNDKDKATNRRSWFVTQGRVVIQITEFFGVIPRFSYQLGRNNYDGKFVPFLNHESVDEAFVLLREIYESNTAAINRAELARAAAMAAHQERADKHLNKKDKKQLQKIGHVSKGMDMEAAERRSAKAKEQNQESVRRMLTAGQIPAALRELEGQEEPVLVIHPGKE